MRVSVNGRDMDVDAAATVASLIAGLNFQPKHVAVEVNRDLVTRRDFAATPLKEGDQIEIVTLVGGG